MNGMPPSLLDKKYKRICLLGEGSYGSVYLYQLRDDHRMTAFESTFKIFEEHRQVSSEYVAIKIYKKPNNKTEGIDFSCLREITCLQVFQHDNIMNCIEVLYNHKKEYNDKKDSHVPFEIAAVMDFHIELKLLLEKSTNEDRQRIAKQILQGIGHMHKNYYFHRDLKPDNIFISRKGFVKLADFGFTKEFGTPYQKYTYNACTLQYRAPEVFMGTHYYTEKSDIWSVGCLIYFIFSGKTMFEVDGNVPEDIDILSQIFYLFGTPTKQNWPGFDKFPIKYKFKTEQKKSLALELGIGQEVGKFLEFVMQLDPVKRPTAEQIMGHEFLKGVISDPFNVEDIFDQKLSKLVRDLAQK